jgi:hypothetical protein
MMTEKINFSNEGLPNVDIPIITEEKIVYQNNGITIHTVPIDSAMYIDNLVFNYNDLKEKYPDISLEKKSWVDDNYMIIEDGKYIEKY